MKTGERIKSRREELGISAEKIAEVIGKAKTTIYRYETGAIEDMPSSLLVPIAKVLRTTPAYLMGWTDNPNDTSTDIMPSNIIPIKKTRIPLLGEISCGTPIYASEEKELYVESGTDVGADFCLIARGDSMIGARIHEGDIVFVRKQEMVEHGEIAVVIINDEATLKRVYYYPDKQKIVLQAENPKYEPYMYVGEELNDIKILGKAIAFQSDVK